MLRLNLRDLRRGKAFVAIAAITWLLTTLSLIVSKASLLTTVLVSLAAALYLALLSLQMKDLKVIQSIKSRRGQSFTYSKEPKAPLKTRQKCTSGYSEPSIEQGINYFAPRRISAVDITEKPTANIAGRNAAQQINKVSPLSRFNALLIPDETDYEPRVIYVGNTNSTLERVARVDYLLPGQATGAPNPNASWLIIDEANLMSSPWDGITNAHATSQLLALFHTIEAARENGTVVVFVQGSVPSHFTQFLIELSDLHIVEGNIVDSPHPGISNLVLDIFTKD